MPPATLVSILSNEFIDRSFGYSNNVKLITVALYTYSQVLHLSPRRQFAGNLQTILGEELSQVSLVDKKFWEDQQ